MPSLSATSAERKCPLEVELYIPGSMLRRRFAFATHEWPASESTHVGVTSGRPKGRMGSRAVERDRRSGQRGSKPPMIGRPIRTRPGPLPVVFPEVRETSSWVSVMGFR